MPGTAEAPKVSEAVRFPSLRCTGRLGAAGGKRWGLEMFWFKKPMVKVKDDKGWMERKVVFNDPNMERGKKGKEVWLLFLIVVYFVDLWLNIGISHCK